MKDYLANARELNAADFAETFYIDKPKRGIMAKLAGMYFYFFFCTLLSFGILWMPMVPAWGLCIYKFYCTVRYLKIYNISAKKLCIFSVLVVGAEFLLAVYARKALWRLMEILFFVISVVF